MKEFLEENEEEVRGAMFDEWSMEDELAVCREEGHVEGLVVAIRNLMASLNMSIEQAMDTLKIPQQDRPNLVARL